MPSANKPKWDCCNAWLFALFCTIDLDTRRCTLLYARICTVMFMRCLFICMLHIFMHPQSHQACYFHVRVYGPWLLVGYTCRLRTFPSISSVESFSFSVGRTLYTRVAVVVIVVCRCWLFFQVLALPVPSTQTCTHDARASNCARNYLLNALSQ